MDQQKMLGATKMYLDAISDYVNFNKIKFDIFSSYFCILNDYITLGGNDYLPYALLLPNCIVILTTDIEVNLYDKIKDQLSNIIAAAIRKEVSKKGIDLVEEAEKFNKNDIYILPYDAYFKAFENFKLAINGKFENIDLVAWAKKLMNIDVGPIFDDKKFIEYSSSKDYLREFVNSTEEKFKGNSKK